MCGTERAKGEASGRYREILVPYVCPVFPVLCLPTRNDFVSVREYAPKLVLNAQTELLDRLSNRRVELYFIQPTSGEAVKSFHLVLQPLVDHRVRVSGSPHHYDGSTGWKGATDFP